MDRMEEVFDDEDESNSFIKNEEVKGGARYVAKKSRNLGITDVSTLGNSKVWWEDSNGTPKIPFDGIPYVVLGTEIRECHQGPQHPHGRKRLAGYTLQMDKDVSSKIHSFVDEGVRNVAEMRRHVTTFVENELLPKYPDIKTTNKRFYPTNRDLRNSIYRFMAETRFSSNDQENLRVFVEKWKSSHRRDKFFYRPVSSDESDPHSFLFIHQTEWQQSLLHKYGQEICLLDATYNTTVYDLPLFFLCVNTNCGYTVVGSFVVGRESRYNIQEALSIIAEWNPQWTPQHFMTDNDQREIGAIENCFPECLVYICDFHREQAWDRWLTDGKHGVGNDAKAEVLSRMLQRWVYAFRKGLVNIRITTTNDLERQHKDFKERYLRNYTLGRTLCGMLNLLINEFLPQCQTTYVRYNVQSLHSYKKYSALIPTFLRNTPKRFLQHCVDRMPPVAEKILASHITREIENDYFCVRSPDSGKAYTIVLHEPIPSCTCPDWQKSHWPCKHMLAVFEHYPGYSWEFLPESYTSSPYFSIDLEFVNQDSNMPQDSTEHPVKVTPSVSSSVESVRQDCFNLLKEINTALYSVSSVDNLDVCLEHVQLLHTEVHKYQEKVDGLPIRTSLPRRKKKSTKRKRFSRKPVSKTQVPESNVEIDGIISMDIDHEIVADEHGKNAFYGVK